jgi:hypothetical protein
LIRAAAKRETNQVMAILYGFFDHQPDYCLWFS